MSDRRLLIICSLLLSVFLTACGREEQPDPVPAPVSPQPSELPQQEPVPPTEPLPATGEAQREEPPLSDQPSTAASSSINAFGFDLYAALRDTSDANLVISPLSIATALGMLLPGTVDEATEQLLAGLHLDNVDQANSELSALAATLHERDLSEGITLAIASRGFVHQDYQVDSEYLAAVNEWYAGELEQLDFSAPEVARGTINDWVAGRTNRLIDELLQPGDLDELTRLMLVNAVYLLADWAQPFNVDNTREEGFMLGDGEEVQVPMMVDTRSVTASVTDQYQAFELPYVGDELAMLVVVPEDMTAFQQELSVERLALIKEELRPREVTLFLPTMETRTNASLSETLATLGVERIFEPDGGWLSGIAEDPGLYVSDVVHETYLRMDEVGTEAAAATAVGVRTTALGSTPVQIRVDRPYFIFLHDRPSNVILFMGSILDPR